MSYTATGRIVAISDTEQVNDKFRKRNFMIDISEEINGNVFANYAKFQVTQNKCEILDSYKIGDMVDVEFNVRGRKWEKDGKSDYFLNLEAWKVNLSGAQPQPQQQSARQLQQHYQQTSQGFPQANETTDDLPF